MIISDLEQILETKIALRELKEEERVPQKTVFPIFALVLWGEKIPRLLSFRAPTWTSGGKIFTHQVVEDISLERLLPAR